MRFELEAPRACPAAAPPCCAPCTPAHRPSPERVPEVYRGASTRHAPPPYFTLLACRSMLLRDARGRSASDFSETVTKERMSATGSAATGVRSPTTRSKASGTVA